MERGMKMESNKKIQMTPKERATAMAKGEEVDRLPCNPNVANGVARVYGKFPILIRLQGYLQMHKSHLTANLDMMGCVCLRTFFRGQKQWEQR